MFMDSGPIDAVSKTIDEVSISRSMDVVLE